MPSRHVLQNTFPGTFEAFQYVTSLLCLEFLQYFNLEFGCFDFIVDQQETYHFLECNTNGQWMWIEDETQLPISKSIALFFKDHHEKKSQKIS